MMGSRVEILLSLFVVALFASSIHGEETESKEFVVTLDHSNFTDYVSKTKFIVVEFYAPWCGHCKSLAPEYEKAASVLSTLDPAIPLAKVDASEEANRGLATQFEIQGFPTLKIMRDGGKNVQDYKGPREADGIVEYVKKQTGPASTELKSAEDATNFIGEKKIVLVGVFPKFSGEEFENFTALAEKLRSDYDIAHTLEAKYLTRGDSSVKGPVVRLFKPFDELFVDTTVFDVEALEKFVEVSSVPVVTIFNKDQDNHPFVVKFFNNANTKAMFFLNFTAESADSMKAKISEVAEQYKGQGISFLAGDIESAEGAFQYFGLKNSQVPLIIVQSPDGKKYLKPNVELDQIAPWVKDFKDGKIPAFKKSEPIPVENNEPVKVVVGNNVEDFVLKSTKNVLLEFYAPWCGHCKKLAPILDEIATSLGSDSDVVIAKLDATTNDYPTDIFEVQGYPTLYFKAASGKISAYEGDRTKEAILEFLEKNKDTTTSTTTTEESVKEAEPVKATEESVKEAESVKDEL